MNLARGLGSQLSESVHTVQPPSSEEGPGPRQCDYEGLLSLSQNQRAPRRPMDTSHSLPLPSVPVAMFASEGEAKLMAPATPQAETAASDLRANGNEWHKYLGDCFFVKPSRQASKEFGGRALMCTFGTPRFQGLILSLKGLFL